MTYNKQTWVDDDPSTPLSAARLTHMENGIEAGNTVEDESIADRHIADGANISQNKIAGLADSLSAKENVSNKDIANGYPALNSDRRVATNRLGSGTANSSTFLRGDGTWAVPAGGGSSTYDELDARDYGIGPGVSAATNTAAINELIADIPKIEGYQTAAGLRVYFPRGVIDYNGQILATRLFSTRFYGEGGKSGHGNAGATMLRYTGSGATSAIRIGSSNGLTFDNIHFSYNSPTFTGYLIDHRRYPDPGPGQGGDTAMITYRDCAFQGFEGAYSATALVCGRSSHNTTFDACHFGLATAGFDGVTATPDDFCNSVTFTNSCMWLMTPTAIMNVDESLNVTGCVFEGTRLQVWTGAESIYRPLTRAYKDFRAPGAVLEGFNWSGNWFGDSNDVAEDTRWLDPGSAKWLGCNFSGNAFLTGLTVIDFGGAGTDGVVLMGNRCGTADLPNVYRNEAGATKLFARGNTNMADIG